MSTTEDQLNELLSEAKDAISRQSSFVLDGENVWPRTVKERYGIFRVKDGGRPELVATCRTKGSIGTTIVELGLKGEFDDQVLGIMDGRDHKDKDGKWIGKWIVKPWVAKPKENN